MKRRGWIYTNLKNDDISIYADIEIGKEGSYFNRLDDKGNFIESGFLPNKSILKITFKEMLEY